MKVQILGTGCPKCRQLEANARAALDEMGVEYELEKVSDIKEIMDFGVMMTPGFAVDGDVKASGKILSIEEIKELVK